MKNKDMLKVGDTVKDFESVNQNGETIKLSDYKGKKVIVFFYPKASTPGCTAEACSLRDSYKELEKEGYVLLGVSADSVKRQSNFAEKNNLPFSLLADEDKKIIEQFGVWGPKKFMGKSYEGIHRTTFVLDENHKISRVIEKVKTKTHADQILDEK